MAVQFTLADGFFNRKRGRPPKNRYVQVYKNLPPQAVFTSFKLEKQHSATLTSLSVQSKENDKRELVLQSKSEALSKMHKPSTTENCVCLTLSSGQRNLNDEAEMELQRKSVIRSTGIYYPDSVPKDNSVELCISSPKENLIGQPELSKNANGDIPQDLSARSRNNDILSSNVKFTYSYLQMLQLINMYSRTLPLQPSAEEVTLNTSLPVEDTMPVEFSRHHFSEDCGIQFCRYRQRQTHYHCIRCDCQYSFCEKSRFAQHITRHKRLDCLLGNDFRQYHPHADCGFPNCVATKPHSKKPSSHFHCLHCSFTCWETYKFVPHRRWHRKLEVLQKTGFQKILYSEHCNFGESSNFRTHHRICMYSGKKTHYHCTVCGGSVLSKFQIFDHQHKSVRKAVHPEES